MKEVYYIDGLYIHVNSYHINIINVNNFCIITLSENVSPDLCKILIELTKRAVKLTVNMEGILESQSRLFLNNQEQFKAIIEGNGWTIAMYNKYEAYYQTFFSGAIMSTYNCFIRYDKQKYIKYVENQTSTLTNLVNLIN